MPEYPVTVRRVQVFTGKVEADSPEHAEQVALGDVSCWEGRGRARLGLVSSDDVHAEVGETDAECGDCESSGTNCLAHRTAEQRAAAGW